MANNFTDLPTKATDAYRNPDDISFNASGHLSHSDFTNSSEGKNLGGSSD
jgi:hypothetical protein